MVDKESTVSGWVDAVTVSVTIKTQAAIRKPRSGKGDEYCTTCLKPYPGKTFTSTHIIHTPAAMFRGWIVTQLKSPEMAQASKQETMGRG